jgi:hypothetical protein
MGGLRIRRHHWRRSRDDLEPAASADPVDMPVAVHDDNPPGVRLEDALKPAAVDEGGADPLGKGGDRHRVFNQVMVQPDDPSGARMTVERRGEPLRLTDGNHSERIGEREIRIRIRIEDRDAETISLRRGQDQRKEIVPEAREAVR